MYAYIWLCKYICIYLCIKYLCIHIYIFIGIHGSDFPSVDSHHLCVVRRNMGTATTKTSSRGCFSPSRCAATHCNTRCNTLQRTATHCEFNYVTAWKFFWLCMCVCCVNVFARARTCLLSLACVQRRALSV